MVVVVAILSVALAVGAVVAAKHFTTKSQRAVAVKEVVDSAAKAATAAVDTKQP